MLRGQQPNEDLFIGDIIIRAKPIRRRTSKYYVPEFLYGGGLYPDYAGGGGFVMSGHTAQRLSSACRQVLQIRKWAFSHIYQKCYDFEWLFFPGGIVPHRRCLSGNVPPADRHQTIATSGLSDLWNSPTVSSSSPSDVRPLFLQRTHGCSQPQRPPNLAHVAPPARPQTELPQQDQPDAPAF